MLIKPTSILGVPALLAFVADVNGFAVPRVAPNNAGMVPQSGDWPSTTNLAPEPQSLWLGITATAVIFSQRGLLRPRRQLESHYWSGGAKRVRVGGRCQRALACIMLAYGATVSSAGAQVDLGTLQSWGFEVYEEIDQTLRVPGTRLFAQSASLSGEQFGGINQRAFVWPASTQFDHLHPDSQAVLRPATRGVLERRLSVGRRRREPLL